MVQATIKALGNIPKYSSAKQLAEKIEDFVTRTRSVATNIYNWWNRPSPESYQVVEQDDLEDPMLHRTVNI